MKPLLAALLLAAPCTNAHAAAEAIVLDEPPRDCAVPFGEARIQSLAPLPVKAPVIVSSESAVVRMVEPRFPAAMRMRREPGFVKLAVVVDHAGRVVETSVLQASRAAFAREAIRAVERWQFVPAPATASNHHRVVHVPIEFRIFRPIR